MVVFFYFVMTWASLGLITLLLLIGHEIHYAPMQNEDIDFKKEVVWKIYGKTILFWPVFLTLLILAWRQGKSVAEYMENREWTLTHWKEITFQGIPMIIQYFEYKGEKVFTHAVGNNPHGKNPDLIVWCRINPLDPMATPIPQGISSTWDTAQKAAQRDRHWRRLCHPSNREEMEREWAEMLALMGLRGNSEQ